MEKTRECLGAVNVPVLPRLVNRRDDLLRGKRIVAFDIGPAGPDRQTGFQHGILEPASPEGAAPPLRSRSIVPGGAKVLEMDAA
jgi:hypothetical protein